MTLEDNKCRIILYTGGRKVGRTQATILQAHQLGRQEGRQEVIDWIRAHPLIAPDKNSLTRFEPFYQIEEAELRRQHEK